MLPSSVRRVVLITPQSPIIGTIAAGSGSRAAAASSSVAFSLGCRAGRHQRRYSSSNPSSPDNGPKDLPAAQSIPAQQSAKSTNSSEKRKRRAKEPSDRAALRALPSVPSTQHLPRESLALSAFFSLHRPISITHSLPKSVTDDAFASIFIPRGRSEKMGEVMSTLSQTVQDLEQPLANLGLGANQQESEGADGVRKISLKHPDGSETGVYVQLNAMSGQFLPFSPPPIPLPEVEAVSSHANSSESGSGSSSRTRSSSLQGHVEGRAAGETGTAPHHRVYKAMLTIEETMDENGEFKYAAHSSRVVEEPSGPGTFLERMALRQLRFDEGRRHENDDMMAVSVRRQRKLKMKKKKYKKLMKRTRNIRRKLDRV